MCYAFYYAWVCLGVAVLRGTSSCHTVFNSLVPISLAQFESGLQLTFSDFLGIDSLRPIFESLSYVNVGATDDEVRNVMSTKPWAIVSSPCHDEELRATLGDGECIIPQNKWPLEYEAMVDFGLIRESPHHSDQKNCLAGQATNARTCEMLFTRPRDLPAGATLMRKVYTRVFAPLPTTHTLLTNVASCKDGYSQAMHTLFVCPP